MKSFVRRIRDIELGLGFKRKKINNEKLKKRYALRRSIYLAEPAKKGQKLVDCKIEFRRPGYGIQPDQFETIAESTLNKNLDSGHLLSFNDLKLK